MKLNQKFTLRSQAPLPGGLSGFWMSVQPTEVAVAYAAGTGPGTADDFGTPTPGTIKPGSVVMIEAAGSGVTCDLAVSPDLSVGGTYPIIPYIVFAGDDDFSGSIVGEIQVVHGPGRLDTEMYDAAAYVAGSWLIASAGTPGNFALKVTGDHKQIIARVGPRGVLNGVMDVIATQNIWTLSI